MSLRTESNVLFFQFDVSCEDWIAAADENNNVHVIDDTREPVAVLKGHPKTIDYIAFSPDGRWIASMSFSAYLIVWNTKTGEVRYNQRICPISPPIWINNEEIIVSYLPYKSGIVNSNTGHIKPLPFDQDIQTLVCVSPDPKKLAWVNGHLLFLFDITIEKLQTFDESDVPSYFFKDAIMIKFIDYDRLLLSTSREVLVWEIRGKHNFRSFPLSASYRLLHTNTSRDETCLVSIERSNTTYMNIFDITSGKCISQVQINDGDTSVYSVVFSHKGDRIYFIMYSNIFSMPTPDTALLEMQQRIEDNKNGAMY